MNRATFLVLCLAMSYGEAFLNARQKVACDVCVRKVKDCSRYIPDAAMFEDDRPAPNKLGKLLVCGASDRELWTTSGSFKVGDEQHLPAESRPGCPCANDQNCNRRQVIEGKLDFVRSKMCDVFLAKQMPKTGHDEQCTAWMKKIVPSSQGGDAHCRERFDLDGAAAVEPAVTPAKPEAPAKPVVVTPAKPVEVTPAKPDAAAPLENGAVINIRQRVACDVCIHKVKDCANYVPDARMFEDSRPRPHKLGKLLVCDASEEEIWTTQGKFKVGDDNHIPAESRPGCPCVDGKDCNRRQPIEGKLDFVRNKMCGLFVAKQMPSTGGSAACSKWMNKVVPNSQGGAAASCNQRFAHDLQEGSPEASMAVMR